MKEPKDWNADELSELIDTQAEESSALEFKSGRALEDLNNDKKTPLGCVTPARVHEGSSPQCRLNAWILKQAGKLLANLPDDAALKVIRPHRAANAVAQKAN